MSFQKILVANRGEIACRVIRTAKEMGYGTVAVTTAADRDALHPTLADESVEIGTGPVSDSYLSAGKIIAAARATGADAIHPGYGFLSENAAFAESCARAGLTFIGPPADAIRLMGSKRDSKVAMVKAGVPCIPGYQGGDQDPARLQAEGVRAGFPLMIKASAGGGGRGMRLVRDEAGLRENLERARSEAENAFGSGELILEKALTDCRHIEIQVFADDHDQVVYLWERDCSVQRRHQKVVEECPSPFVDAALRRRMGETAVAAARACGYRGAGTVEFLVDGSGAFYFLEMNTRLQVEHPVTEMVTGTDLVAWQILVAAGRPLPLTQEEIPLDGHAMEVRLYAEEPAKGYLPATGPVLRWQPAALPGVRVDHGLREGQVIGSHYDPMLAKLIATGRDREEARRLLIQALEKTVLFGLPHNGSYLRRILQHPVFAAGDATTGFMDGPFAGDPGLHMGEPAAATLALAAALRFTLSGLRPGSGAGLLGWRNSNPAPTPLILAPRGSDGVRTDVSLEPRRGNDLPFTVRVHGHDEPVRLTLIPDDRGRPRWLETGGVRRALQYLVEGTDRLWLQDGSGGQECFTDITHREPEAAAGAGTGQIRAPMDGAIVSIQVRQGDRVSRGQTLAVLEAMKMEHQLRADLDGTVAEIGAAPGDQVKSRQLIIRVEEASEGLPVPEEARS